MISMRSRMGSAIGSSMFAVVINSTFESYVQVVITECGILLGIQSLEQRRGGIAAEVAPDLIDFVEHENWILGFGATNALDNLPGQRPDVSAAVAANFGFVMYATERDPDELAS